MRRTALEKWICETEALPCLTREGLEALQLKRLNALLQRERQRGGYYKDLPAELDSLKELESLPFTLPEALAENAAGLLLVSQAGVERVISGATSGTTGPEKRIFYTARDLENTVDFFSAGISEMASRGEGVMIALPFSGPDGLGELIARAVETLGARPVKAGFGKSYGELEQIIKEERPAAYIGMPAPLLSLIRYCGGPMSLERALTSADACPEGLRRELESSLKEPLFPHYGSRETALGGAVTCAAHEGMHLRENHIIAEIVDKRGEALPPGAEGELVITTIGLEAMPLIRYKTGDRARILQGYCPCGGITKRIEVFGREFSEEPDIKELDGALFRLPFLTDCAYMLKGGRLKVRALTIDGEGEGEMLAIIKNLYPEFEAEAELMKCTGESTPLYMGKRYIERNLI
ncbi:MAG: AMP-binding protein [Oscillospiraceae bacterium]|nr:AMP-binding protein [Oscillospiraceae bacterium]